MTHELIKVWKDEVGRRWYLFDSDPYPYVSATSLVAIPKAFRYSKDDLNDEEGEANRKGRDEKSTTRLKQAGKIGTDIHSVLEWHNSLQINRPYEVDMKLVTRYKQILDNYIELVKEIELSEGIKIEVVEVERQCINTRYKYAGRFDLLVKCTLIDTEEFWYEIWDYKTSKEVHEEDGWQLAGYMLSLILEGINVKRVRIIHINKISKRVTDLLYVHHIPMILNFLGQLQTFKGMYWNDLIKGRINDIDDFTKYKWPLDVMQLNCVIDFNNNKENIMELKEVTGLGNGGGSYTKDPNKVSFPENEAVIGVILGETIMRVIHKGDKGQVFLCDGKDKCERCKLGMPKQPEFKANFLTIDENDKPVIKKIESNSWGLYFGLSDALKEVKEANGDVRTAVMSITRTGKAKSTKYDVQNIAPKHKAFQNIAETIKPMTPFELSFTVTKTLSEAPKVDRTNIIDKE